MPTPSLHRRLPLRALALIACILIGLFAALYADIPAAQAAHKRSHKTCTHRKHHRRRCRHVRHRRRRHRDRHHGSRHHRRRHQRQRAVRHPVKVRRARSQAPFWTGNFSADNWSQWDGSPAYHPDGNPADFGLVSSPTPSGDGYAFRATLESGNGSVVSGQDGERTLLTLWPSTDDGVGGDTHAYQGANTWYRDEFYFPSGFQPSADTSWNWVWELHDFPDTPCCANLALSVVTDSEDGGAAGGERLSLRVMGGGTPADPIDSGDESAYDNSTAVVKWIKGPNLVSNHWYDMAVHVRWNWRSDAQGGDGSVEYYLDGKEIGSYTGPTLFYYRSLGSGGTGPGPGQAYLQEGYYRPDDGDAGYAQPTVSVYQANTTIGPSAASIGQGSL